jgi:hypothetical protein
MSTTDLGWTLCGVALLALVVWLAVARPWRKSEEPDTDSPTGETSIEAVR